MRAERADRLLYALSHRMGHVHVAVEALYHRHNVSAVLRTCDALGLQHVHLVEGHFTPSRGAARGAERWLTLHHHTNPEDAVAAVRAAGLSLWIADLDDDGVVPERVPLHRPVCLWFGAELAGVSDVVREAADGIVTVPMRGFAQSLNVSVAAAMTIHAVAERARALGDHVLLPEAEREALHAMWLEREEARHRGAAHRAALAFDDEDE